MAKILCSISGIEYQCQHFPIYLDEGTTAHPIFSVPLKRLWKYLPKWQAGELTETDSLLLFLGVLRATELVEFRCSILRTPQTNAIISQNMERLFSIVSKVITIKHPRFTIPRFVVSKETRDLSNIRYWLESWSDQYHSFMSGLVNQELRSKLQRKEAALEKLIKNPAIHPIKYAHILADWASEAGEFPSSSTLVQGVATPLDEYWKSLIIKCHRDIDMISIPEADLQELLTHCEDAIENGSIFSYHLFNSLRDGLDTIRGFFSIGSTTFSLVDSPSTPDAIETANLENLIQSAPHREPSRSEYPTEFAYMKAKMRWSLAVRNSKNTVQEEVK